MAQGYLTPNECTSSEEALSRSLLNIEKQASLVLSLGGRPGGDKGALGLGLGGMSLERLAQDR